VPVKILVFAAKSVFLTVCDIFYAVIESVIAALTVVRELAVI